MEWACKECEQNPESDNDNDIHPFTRSLLEYRYMTMAGYPFDPHDLSLDEWILLGRVMEFFEVMNNPFFSAS